MHTAITKIHHESRKNNMGEKPPVQKPTKRPVRRYSPPAERGLGPTGGGWNIAQAARWSGLSEIHLRALIKARESGQAATSFPYHKAGRRIVIPRDGFRAWFNALNEGPIT
jgi:hypothetical protein